MANVTGEQKIILQQEELERDIDSRIRNFEKMPAANIIVAGITGVGKSTLINAVFGSEMAATGVGRPVTEHIDEYKKEDVPICIWDTVGFELDPEKTKKSIESIRTTIAEKASSENPYNRIHAIWYCINAASNKYQGAELEFIRELHSTGIPFIIVLTQCFLAENQVNDLANEIRKTNSEMGIDDIEIVPVLADPISIMGLSTPIPSYGLEDLVNVTLNRLPNFIKQGFIAAQRVSLAEKRRECEKIICRYVRESQSGVRDNIPLINVRITDNKIMLMFKELGAMYNTVLHEDSIKKVMGNTKVDFKDNFFGLISPLDMGYSENITNLLEQKKADGFSVEVADVKKSARAARMIAFYGYTFMDSIEEMWRTSTEAELKNVDLVVNRLTEIVNQKLWDWKHKVEQK